MDPQTLIFVGPPGSGKGTQASETTNFLAANSRRGVLHLESGSAFRRLAKTDTSTGRRVQTSMENGNIQPAFLAVRIWADTLINELSPDMHLIIDGAPRRLLEAKLLAEALSFYKRENITVIHLDIPVDVVYERLSDRGRDDDAADVVERRLEQYQELTQPVVNFYKASTDVDFTSLDGTQSIGAIQKEVQEIVSA